MEPRSIGRPAGSFQQPLSAGEIVAMAERAFGAPAVSAVELGGGLYNTTYRVELPSRETVVLRVAPEPGRQFRIERELMRNEHVSLPFFAPIARLMPRTLFADWTRDIAGRDYVFQTFLPGIPAPQGLRSYPRPQWTAFYRDLGALARTVHEVRGPAFGPVAGPAFATWSEAVLTYFADTAADLTDAGLDASDIRAVARLAEQRRVVLDEITEPRLLHGDLWTANVLLSPGAPEPLIDGVLDHDRASWGDPAADWSQYAASRPDPVRDAFWAAYGRPADTAQVRWRALVYRARHLGAVRLERHRLGNTDGVAASYLELRAVLDALAA
ncbi:aminoglycoside phosphotransferase (APT) family kinase protein [Amycolatopsis thermoflava]|uniref:Aminoglycoside phosphotransferase (APT) family kinase protein n=2 Tax=Amycolatopsis thermoflava TaxID=84480 RepID=A0A3N2H818_9PSEU|nr:aminoglycoside phosphotransferase (APT) family kinase protein [Amycolatopsis thermoflava]